MTVTEWASETGLPVQTIFKRLYAGWNGNRCVTVANRTKTGISIANPVEFHAWKAMHARCKPGNRKERPKYAARGISVCERWTGVCIGFANFFADMGSRPSAKHSLDRIDNDRGYSPDNCRWATAKQQAGNTRRNRKYEHDGLSLTVPEWAEKTGIPQKVLRQRIVALGWSVKRSLTQPVLRPGKYNRPKPQL